MPRCVHCGEHRSTPVLVSAQRLELVRCARCHLVYLRDWEARIDRSIYDYYAARLEWSDSDLYIDLNAARLRAVLDTLSARAPGRRLLDVGCGEGLLIRVAAESGWTAEGIEMSQPAVAICQSRGLNASVTDFFSSALDDRRYDVITMVELIEHVPEPGGFLARAEQLLAPGGLLYLTTPNFASLGRRILKGDWTAISAVHLSYFTPRSLRRVVADSTALEVRRIGTRNLSAPALRRIVRRRLDPSGLDLPAIARLSQEGMDDQVLRHRIEGSPVLRAGKGVVNAGLRAAGAGEQMTATLRRPPA